MSLNVPLRCRKYILHVGNIIFMQEIYSLCSRYILYVGNIFFMQEIYSLYKKYILYVGDIFFMQEIYSFCRKYIPYVYFDMQEIYSLCIFFHTCVSMSSMPVEIVVCNDAPIQFTVTHKNTSIFNIQFSNLYLHLLALFLIKDYVSYKKKLASFQ